MALNLVIPAYIPLGVVGENYSFTPVVYGINTSLTWSILDGVLPDGISLNSNTGEISGIPTTVGTYNVAIKVTDEVDQICTAGMQIRIWDKPCLSFNYMPEAFEGIDYTTTLEVCGGSGSYNWSLTGGALPDGLSLDALTGEISGTPTTRGVYDFTITANDNEEDYVESLELQICVGYDYYGYPSYAKSIRFEDPIKNVYTHEGDLVEITHQVDYNFDFDTSEMTGSIIAGDSPPGLLYEPPLDTVDAAAHHPSISYGGYINFGTGIKQFIYRLTNNNRGDYDQFFDTLFIDDGPFRVLGSPLHSLHALPNSIVNKNYQEFCYCDFVSNLLWGPHYVWEVIVLSGSFPPGIEINCYGFSSGDILPEEDEIEFVGTPTEIGIYEFVLKIVLRQANYRKEGPIYHYNYEFKPFTIVIAPDSYVRITTNANLPSAGIGETYSVQLEVTGGWSPYTWSIVKHALPDGLSLNSETGEIHGTVKESGYSYFIATVTDKWGYYDMKLFMLEVHTELTSCNSEYAFSELPTGFVNIEYKTALVPILKPTTWVTQYEIDAGNLPPGLSIDQNLGIISGVPRETGTSAFAPKLTWSNGYDTCTETADSLSIKIVDSDYDQPNIHAPEVAVRPRITGVPLRSPKALEHQDKHVQKQMDSIESRAYSHNTMEVPVEFDSDGAQIIVQLDGLPGTWETVKTYDVEDGKYLSIKEVERSSTALVLEGSGGAGKAILHVRKGE